MTDIIVFIYVLGFCIIFFAERNLGERIWLSVLKALVWFIWIFVLLFNRTGNNT